MKAFFSKGELFGWHVRGKFACVRNADVPDDETASADVLRRAGGARTIVTVKMGG